MSAAAGLLAGFHAMIAMRRNEAHWMLSDADAKRYGLALSNAIRWLPIVETQKYFDFAALAGCVVEMEGLRVYRSAQLAQARARGPIPPGGATVFTFTPPPRPAGAAGNPDVRPGQPGRNPDEATPPIAEPPADEGGDAFGP